ncbi:MAG: 50S ribosomal protein L24 [Candidatus Nanohaloarchaea archaeon]
MVDKTQNWSSSWKSSTNQSKQRKYRDNAPMHVRDKFISANLNQTLRDELGVRNLGIRVGDRAKVMRGDDSGVEGIVSNIDRQEEKIYINNLDRQKIDGTMKEKPLDPSNLQLQALNLEDDSRIEKYDVDDFSEIEVEEEELEQIEEDEDENEMMQKMQQQGQPTDFDTEEDEETKDVEEESETGEESEEKSEESEEEEKE